MKKWIGVCVATAAVVGAVWFYQNCYLPEFEIVSTIKTGCDDFASVYLNVRVNDWIYNYDEIILRIEEYYCGLNGVPDELHIELMKNKSQFVKN